MVTRQVLTAEESVAGVGVRDAGPAPEGHPASTTAATDADIESLDDVPPPAYGEIYGHIDGGEENRGTEANVTDDGRVDIRIDEKTRSLTSLMQPALRSSVSLDSDVFPTSYLPPNLVGTAGDTVKPPPPMNVVIHVVGSRGDVQPFVALGKVLKQKYRHRVRIATHEVFRSFVQDSGLEFFCIGGDPSELMAFMVKNPGLMPDINTIRTGDIGRRRRETYKMVKGCYRSCIEAGDGTGTEASDSNVADIFGGAGNVPLDDHAKPFVADAIIANPPSFAHIHVAEKMGLPLHLMFTMPWSPTQAFPHPLANIQSSNAGETMTNFMSYALVDMLTWQGLGDVINRFRQTVLGLDPIGLSWAPGLLARLRVPYTYCWSPALIPKPRDWKTHINISGFFFLPLGTNYIPDAELEAFLAAGPPPVYIGFGSIVVDDPNAMTNLIFDAVRRTGQRALVSKGWGGFGGQDLHVPENVFMLGNVPHDWLFKHVSCVVHHGGAGTTSAGVAAGKPTVIVPFFGDQPFWGSMVARAGAGPDPIHHKQLTAGNLADAITKALSPECVEKAREMSEKIASEEGSQNGARSFHKQLELGKMRCHLCPDRIATWKLKRSNIRLSAFAAATLGAAGLIEYNQLKLFRATEWDTEGEPWDPITGVTSSLIETAGSCAMGIADMPVQVLKALRIHPEAYEAAKARKKSKGKENEATELSQELSEESWNKELAENVGNKNTIGPSSAPQSSSGAPAVSEDEGYSTDHNTTRSTQPRDDTRLGAQAPETTTKAAESGSSSISSQRTARTGSEAATLHPSSATTTSPRPDTSTSDNVRDRASSSASQGQGFSLTRENLEATLGAGQGLWRISSTLAKSPMDFTMSLARGFHNAPKLYGDTTVRKHDKISGVSSGFKAAGKGFALGLADGIGGFITQPILGAQKEGAVGFVKGFGKGIGGIVLKPSAAAFSIPAYTMKGIYKELQSRLGPSVNNYIIASRTAQGYEEFNKGDPEEQTAVVQRFQTLKRFMKHRDVLEEELQSIESDFWVTHQIPEECQEIVVRADSDENSSRGHSSTTNTGPVGRSELPAQPMPGAFKDDNTSDDLPPKYRNSIEAHNRLEHSYSEKENRNLAEIAEWEEAIKRSVEETSRGNAEEDAMVERAIRASFAELESKKQQGANDEEMQAAMKASLEEANKGLPISDDNDEELRKALEQSQKDHADEDEEMHKALEQSRQDHEKGTADREQAKREEEIVMQYVMRQSALESEYLQQKGGQSSSSGL